MALEQNQASAGANNAKNGGPEKMKRKAYEKELYKLQVQLCHLQDWVKEKGLRVIILFEGRDAAGKGGTIKAITERVRPRVFGWPRFRPRRIGKRRNFTFSATSSGSRLREKSSSSIAAGTTGLGSNM